MRYRHLRRTVIAVLAAIAFALGLVLLAKRTLETPYFRRATIRWLEQAADAHRAVEEGHTIGKIVFTI